MTLVVKERKSTCTAGMRPSQSSPTLQAQLALRGVPVATSEE